MLAIAHDVRTSLECKQADVLVVNSTGDLAAAKVTLGGKANLVVREANWPSTETAPIRRVPLSGSVVYP